MNTTDALRWLGPEVAQQLARADSPLEIAVKEEAYHRERRTHHGEAWEAVRRAANLDATGRYEDMALWSELLDAQKLVWREAIQDDPIPPWALRAALEEAEWTYEDLAQRIRSSRRAVQEWADGKRRCTGPASVAVIHAIHKAVGCA